MIHKWDTSISERQSAKKDVVVVVDAAILLAGLLVLADCLCDDHRDGRVVRRSRVGARLRGLRAGLRGDAGRCLAQVLADARERQTSLLLQLHLRQRPRVRTRAVKRPAPAAAVRCSRCTTRKLARVRHEPEAVLIVKFTHQLPGQYEMAPTMIYVK